MRLRGPEFIGTILLVALIVWFGAATDPFWRGYSLTGQKHDYYNLLIDGFLEGHLHLKAEVDPDRLSPDPAVRGRAAYLLDASLYRGKYYLYFGVTPALGLFLPYAWITGHDLPENFAILICVLVGFAFQAALFHAARRRYCPGAGRLLNWIAVGMLGLGVATPILLTRAMFYEVAIASGYAAISAVWLCLFHAWHSPRRGLLWLAAASIAIGLAVGSRPTYVVVLPMVLLAAAGHACLATKACRRERTVRWIRSLGAAIIPAGIIGLGLMAYNHARFGDPFEFGMTYQQGMPVAAAAWRFLQANLIWYHFTPPVLSPFFPYIAPINAAIRPPGYHGIEVVHGQFALTLLVVYVGAWATITRPWRAAPLRFTGFVALQGAGFLLLLVTVCAIPFRADRYTIDFQSTLASATVLLAALTSSVASSVKPALRRSARAGFLVLGACTMAVSVLSGFENVAVRRPEGFRRIATVANWPSHLAHCLGLLTYGPIRFQVSYPTEALGRIEALASIGTPGYTDVLQTVHHPTHHVSFSAVHTRYSELASELLQLEPGRRYTIEWDCGALYPPREHPYYRGWQADEVERRKTFVRVTLDGTRIIQGYLKSYDAPPGSLLIGQHLSGWGHPFSGTIFRTERLSPSLPAEPSEPEESGVWSIELGFALDRIFSRHPVLASGVSGAGNLLLVEILPENRIRFGIDFWGHGLVHSDPIAVVPDRVYRLDCLVGPQIVRSRTATSIGELESRIHLRLDGTTVWSVPVMAHGETYKFVALGSNVQGFSTTPMRYFGDFRVLHNSREEERKLIQQAVAPSAP